MNSNIICEICNDVITRKQRYAIKKGRYYHRACLKELTGSGFFKRN